MCPIAFERYTLPNRILPLLLDIVLVVYIGLKLPSLLLGVSDLVVDVSFKKSVFWVVDGSVGFSRLICADILFVLEEIDRASLRSTTILRHFLVTSVCACVRKSVCVCPSVLCGGCIFKLIITPKAMSVVHWASANRS